jgi:hypothetical protein
VHYGRLAAWLCQYPEDLGNYLLPAPVSHTIAAGAIIHKLYARNGRQKLEEWTHFQIEVS